MNLIDVQQFSSYLRLTSLFALSRRSSLKLRVLGQEHVAGVIT